jgi:chromosome segregation ATPase
MRPWSCWNRSSTTSAKAPTWQAYALDRAVAVGDLGTAPTWGRIDAVVGQLHVRGVLSVPIRLAGQPVGTLDVYSIQPRAWTTHELAAMAEFATVAAELVHTGVELASRELEVAQLQQALTSRIWIEQAKGVLAATQGVSPDEAFGQLRRRARASSRRLAEVAREVVQDAQRERLAALALDDARVLEAEARAQAAEQALQAAQADLARRRAALDQAQVAAEERDRIANERNHAADQRDRVAEERDRAADEREHLADERDRAADEREHMADDRDRIADERDRVADERGRTAGHHD